MSKIRTNPVVKWTVSVSLAASFSILSLLLTVKTGTDFVTATAIASFVLSLYFIHRMWDTVTGALCSRHGVTVFALLFTVSTVIALNSVTGVPESGKWGFFIYPFTLIFRCLAAPAIFFVSEFVTEKAFRFVSGLYAETDVKERRIYLAATVILSLAVMLLYSSNAKWYTQFDAVYSIDSGYCRRNMFPKLYYYDIRHPLFSVFAFPLWSFVRFVCGMLVPGQLLDLVCVVTVQLINVQLLLLTGLMIGRLSENRYVFPMWLASSPFMIFAAFFEKYQICVFLLVLYTYCVCRKKQGAEYAVISAVGLMPTGIFLFPGEMLMKEPLKKRLLRIWHTFAAGVALLVCGGRIHLLLPDVLFSEVSGMAQHFGIKHLPIGKCLNSFTNLVHGSFLGITSHVDGKKYIWVDVLSKASVIGIVILLFMLIGIAVGRKRLFTRMCAVWTVAAAALFVGFQWSVHASPLFSIYFAWAFIPLFCEGVDFLAERLRASKTAIYSVMIAGMAIINFMNMIEINQFLKKL